MIFFKHNMTRLSLSILLLAVVGICARCGKAELAKYSGDDFLYFTNTHWSETSNGENIGNSYTESRRFTFLLSTRQFDTMFMTTLQRVDIAIEMDGRLAKHDRKISLDVEGNGKEYCLLPDVNNIYIAADSTRFKLDMPILRPPLDDTTTKVVTLTLRNNADFSPEKHVWHKLTYIFGNLLDKPISYESSAATLYGPFSRAKMDAMREAVAREGANYWYNDKDVITMNEFLPDYELLGVKKLRALKFDPFNFNELYYFMDLRNGISGVPANAPVMVAMKSFAERMVDLTKKLVIERREAGTPILDEEGEEITFP